MRQKSGPEKQPAEAAIRDIRRATRRHFSAEEKIRIVLEGLRGEESVAELCRREGIASSLYYGWSKEFLEAGKRRHAGDTARDLWRGEGSQPRGAALKEVVDESVVGNAIRSAGQACRACTVSSDTVRTSSSPVIPMFAARLRQFTRVLTTLQPRAPRQCVTFPGEADSVAYEASSGCIIALAKTRCDLARTTTQ